MLCVYLTCKDNNEGEKIASLLLDRKLVACVNIFPVLSMYLWKGKKKISDEVALLCKTVRAKLPRIKEEITNAHSYDLPVVSAWEEETSKEVEEWLKYELGGEQG